MVFGAALLCCPLSSASLLSTSEVTKLMNLSVGQGLVGCLARGHSAPVICPGCYLKFQRLEKSGDNESIESGVCIWM